MAFVAAAVFWSAEIDCDCSSSGGGVFGASWDLRLQQFFLNRFWVSSIVGGGVILGTALRRMNFALTAPVLAMVVLGHCGICGGS